ATSRRENDARMSRRCSALRARNRALSHCIFGSFYRASLDDLPRRLRLEYCWLLGERIDALSRFCGGFLDHYEFGESGHNEGTRCTVAISWPPSAFRTMSRPLDSAAY